MLDVTFRTCQPKDVDQAVPLIYSSGPTAFDYVFCDRAADESIAFLRDAFVHGTTEFGCQQHTAVLYNDHLVGVGGVRFAHQNFRFTIAAVREIFRFYNPLAAARTIRRGLRIEQVLQPPKNKAGILYNLGVAPDFQSKGVGQQLIHYLIGKAAAQKMEKVALDVAVTNLRAHALYQRLGFAQAARHTSNLESAFGYVVDHIYMEMPIEK